MGRNQDITTSPAYGGLSSKRRGVEGGSGCGSLAVISRREPHACAACGHAGGVRKAPNLRSAVAGGSAKKGHYQVTWAAAFRAHDRLVSRVVVELGNDRTARQGAKPVYHRLSLQNYSMHPPPPGIDSRYLSGVTSRIPSETACCKLGYTQGYPAARSCLYSFTLDLDGCISPQKCTSYRSPTSCATLHSFVVMMNRASANRLPFTSMRRVGVTPRSSMSYPSESSSCATHLMASGSFALSRSYWKE